MTRPKMPGTDEEKRQLLIQLEETFHVVPEIKKRLERMHKLHGIGPAATSCGSCVHFFGVVHAKEYFKCRLYGVTNGPATDWRYRWQSCGKYEARENDGHEKEKVFRDH